MDGVAQSVSVTGVTYIFAKPNCQKRKTKRRPQDARLPRARRRHATGAGGGPRARRGFEERLNIKTALDYNLHNLGKYCSMTWAGRGAGTLARPVITAHVRPHPAPPPPWDHGPRTTSRTLERSRANSHLHTYRTTDRPRTDTA